MSLFGLMRPIVKILAATLATMAMASSAPAVGRPLSCATGPFIVFFPPRAAALDSDAVKILEFVVEMYSASLKGGVCRPSALVVDGFTDVSEKRWWSRIRAQRVRNYLVAHGIKRGMITIRWFGSDRPRDNSGANGSKMQNRRVEITITP